MRRFRATTFAMAVACLLLSSTLRAEDAEAAARRGTKLYEQDKYEEAAKAFQRARELARKNGELPPTLDYNLGTTLARQGDFERAVETLRQAAEAPEPEETPQVRERAFYNLGVSEARKAEALREQGPGQLNAEFETLQRALSAFRQSLILNPDDANARHNYAVARRRLKEIESQMQQRQQQQGQQQPSSDGKQSGEEQQSGGEQQSENQEGDPTSDASSGGEPSPESEQEGESGEPGRDRSQSSDGAPQPTPSPQEQGEPDEREEQQSRPAEDGQRSPREADEAPESRDREEEDSPASNQAQRGGLEATPTPRPDRTPRPSGQTSGQEQTGGADESQAQPAAPTGPGDGAELTPEQLDALRVLNSLEEGHPDQFRQLFRFRGGESRDLERDW